MARPNTMSWGAFAATLLFTGAALAAAPLQMDTGKAAQTTQRVAQAAPATAAQPEVTTATYQDWIMRCVSPPSGVKVCEAAQTIQVQGQTGAIAMIGLGKANAESPLRLVIQLPAGIWLPAGVKFQLGEKAAPVSLAFTRCVQGCFAEIDVDKALEQSLRAAPGPGTITFVDGARRPVTVPLSLKGLVPALDAALKAR